MDIFNNDQDIRRVLMQLINGYYSPQDPELFRDIYNSLLNTQSSDRADTYFILKDFRSYAEAHKKIDRHTATRSGGRELRCSTPHPQESSLPTYDRGVCKRYLAFEEDQGRAEIM